MSCQNMLTSQVCVVSVEEMSVVREAILINTPKMLPAVVAPKLQLQSTYNA